MRLLGTVNGKIMVSTGKIEISNGFDANRDGGASRNNMKNKIDCIAIGERGESC